MAKKALTLFIILLALTMVACAPAVDEFSKIETNIAAGYLRQQGYEILEHRHSRTYVLLQTMLLAHPHLPVWSVQAEDVSKYLKKRVTYETFEVRNHPLDNWKGSMEEMQAKGKTTVLVIVVGNKAIGGTAIPVTDLPLGGLIFSLEGRTLEEIHGKSYAQWLEEWQTRFR